MKKWEKGKERRRGWRGLSLSMRNQQFFFRVLWLLISWLSLVGNIGGKAGWQAWWHYHLVRVREGKCPPYQVSMATPARPATASCPACFPCPANMATTNLPNYSTDDDNPLISLIFFLPSYPPHNTKDSPSGQA